MFRIREMGAASIAATLAAAALTFVHAQPLSAGLLSDLFGYSSATPPTTAYSPVYPGYAPTAPGVTAYSPAVPNYIVSNGQQAPCGSCGPMVAPAAVAPTIPAVAPYRSYRPGSPGYAAVNTTLQRPIFPDLGLRGLFGCRDEAPAIPPPAYPNVYPPTLGNPCAPPCDPCAQPDPCGQTVAPAFVPAAQPTPAVTAGFAPFTAYRTVWRRVPVTTYRPVMGNEPTTGCATTALMPCTTYQWQAQRVRQFALFPRLREWLEGRRTTTAVVPAVTSYRPAVGGCQACPSPCAYENCAPCGVGPCSGGACSDGACGNAFAAPGGACVGCSPGGGAANDYYSAPANSDVVPQTLPGPATRGGDITPIPETGAPELPGDSRGVRKPGDDEGPSFDTSGHMPQVRMMPAEPAAGPARSDFHRLAPIPDARPPAPLPLRRVTPADDGENQAPRLLDTRDRTASSLAGRNVQLVTHVQWPQEEGPLLGGNTAEAAAESEGPALIEPARPAPSDFEEELWDDSGWTAAPRSW